ncbi:MAG: hypothetical protein LBT06_18880 [Hungatella sp.]|jgi:hypothetical protein|uniref:DUF6774 domain-containing protein n=1 Tax=Lacrimispora sp. BS-2 TaxID=3151850 RepID=A0AAU7PKF1_9FIRM|nr:hypothetical protein [Hungatella sp.]MDR1550633.1 hypothetical protein [Hungatella sp.]MDR1773055.1 hypothetical protein [Hungatella sp.]MDR2023315.1 hypothetical protein [Hungatella sp.]
MQPCELVMFVSSLACCIAEDRSSDELALLGAIFSQLGDSLATIAAQQDLCCDLNEKKDTS